MPRGRIEELLVEAARNAELEDPFVSTMELGDFSVTYRVTAKLPDVKGLDAANAKQILTAPAQLRAEMMDALHKGDIEIVSPTFMHTRAFPADKKFMSKPTWARAATAPTTKPSPVTLIPCPTTRLKTSSGVLPMAMRIPISLRRWLTEYARAP